MVVKRPTPPCMNCMDRELGCHDSCTYFKDYKKELEKYNKLVNKGRWNEAAYRDTFIRGIRRMIRGRQ